MKLAPSAGFRPLFAAAILLLATQVLLTACDATAILFVDQVKWDQLHVLSTNPVVKVSDEYEPLCRSVTEDPVGLRFNVLFQGSTKKGDSGERDLSIKPDDYVDNKNIDIAKVTESLFEFNIECLEPYPDDDLNDCPGAFTGGDLPIQKVDFFDYYQEEATNDARVAVAVVLDMSGSMLGLATPHHPYNEDSFDTISSMLAGDDAPENATDPKGARFAALESFIKTLNDQDALIVFWYNENNIDIACSEGESFDDRKDLCLSNVKGFVTDDNAALGGKSPLDFIKGDEKGRTPLWSAVDEVYRYMQSDAVVEKYPGLRHILVIGDGPDTCADSTDQSQCTGQCLSYNVSYETVRADIESQEMADRVPIHFVQMQAKGYRERDPRQQEMSCLTNGQYMFINTLDIPQGRLQDVLSKTFSRIRYTFRGYWRFAVNLSTVKKGTDPDPGWLYALKGSGKVKAGKERMLVPMEDLFEFKVNDEEVYGTNHTDRRVSFRKECDPSAADACPGETVYSECSSLQWWCDEQTLTCQSAEAWEDNGELATCKPQDVRLAVEVRRKDTGTNETKVKEIKSVETRCCRGGCMPPGPPEIPDDVVKPAGMAAGCFWWEENRGWVWANPNKYETECTSNAACPGDAPQCVSNICVTTCFEDGECKDGFECTQSRCKLPCTADAECAAGLHEGFACAEGHCEERTCDPDTPCPSGFFCDGEVCALDFSNEEDFAWIFFGTLTAPSCNYEDLEPHLTYQGVTLKDEHWDYCESENNCFQPPGFEAEPAAGD